MEFSVLDQVSSNLTIKQVGIEEFAESSTFCDKQLYPRQKLFLKLVFLEELTDFEESLLDDWISSKEVAISPDIRDRVKWCKDNNYPHFREVIMVGGRRSSKGFLTSMVLAKKMYDTLQLQDPNQYYGIDRNKEIYFTCVAASEKQAKELQYSDFAGTVNTCKAMEPYIAKMQELEFSVHTEADLRRLEAFKRQKRRVQKDISKLRGRALASNSRTIRGYTSMGICFDEMAFFMQGESDQADDAVYEAAIPSLSQFGKDGILFCNSSPYSKVGKFYERFQASQSLTKDTKIPDHPTMFGVQFPSWAMYQDWWEDPTYKGNKFCMQVSPDWNPNRLGDDGEFYYNDADRSQIAVEQARERDNPDSYKVEHRAIWAEVVDSYLDPDMVDRMYAGRPLPDGKGFVPMKTNWNDSTYAYKYRAHLDPSSTTAGFGFALGHVEHIEVNGILSEHVIFDIIKRWRPDDFPGGVIDWQMVISEVIKYVDLFRPYEVTLDQFQSAAPIQELRRELMRRGIGETHVYEKVATSALNWNRAETFKTALYQGLVHAPSDHSDALYAAEELKYLQQINGGRLPRVEKQDVGPVTTKDMADCIMEVTESLIGNIIANQIRQDLSQPPIYGGAGGYAIGGPDRGGHATRPGPMSDLYTRRVGEQQIPGGMSRDGMSPGRRGSSIRRGSNPARGRW